MKLHNSIAYLSLASSVLAGQSLLNILNEETGDFGGFPFPERNRFETFIEKDQNGDVTSYGLYIPKLSTMGLDFTTSTAGPPLGAALDFDKSSLADPSQVPFEFVGINFNPGGHPGAEYLIPHFDLHFWLHPNEFARGIECNGTTFPPCQTTQWLSARYSNLPSNEYFPPNTTALPAEWVPTMGAHIVPIDPDDDFDAKPAVIVGSYLGKVIYYEPMIASKIFLNTETNGPADFPWPQLKLPTPGRYYRNIRIEYESVNQRYKLSLDQLVVAPEEHRGKPIYIGEQFSTVSPIGFTTSVSGSKNCLINSGNIVDGGYSVEAGGFSLCCRARGNYDNFFSSCENNVCGVPTPVVPSSPSSFVFNPLTDKCYARCVLRV